MSEIHGHWCSGRTSARLPAALVLEPSGRVRVERLPGREALLVEDGFTARVSPRLGDTDRTLTFADGGQFVTNHNQAVDELLQGAGERAPQARVNGWERHGWVWLMALAILGLLAFGGVKWGVPAAADLGARVLPDALYRAADRQALAIMDRVMLGPSRLPQKTRLSVSRSFQPLLREHRDLGLKVFFRRGGSLGANAFALPGGAIVFTDEMVKKSRDWRELTAVLAHEAGHVAHRHAMRRLLQGSLLALAVMAATGETSGVSELFIGLPVLLTERHYSREFERQADLYALAYLCRAGVSPMHFVALMERLAAEDENRPAREAKGGGMDWKNYLSTHPSTAERLKVFREACARP